MQWNCCVERMCSTVLCCHSIVFCKSVSADCSGMAASRFLPAAAACVILLRFAAESRQSYCNGSVRRVNGALEADFFDFGTDDFPFKIPFKKCFKIVVFPLSRRDPVLELQIAAVCGAVVRSSILQLKVVNPWEEHAAVLLTFMAAF